MSDNCDSIETDGECLLYLRQKYNPACIDDITKDTVTKSQRLHSNASDSSLQCKKTLECFDSGIQCSSANSLELNFDSMSIYDKLPIPCLQQKLQETDVDEGLAEHFAISEVEIDLCAKDNDGDTLIHIGIVSHKRELTKLLIGIADDIACLNIQNKLHQTPLHLAVLTSQQDIVRSLVLKGANVNIRDKQGNTPLHIACRKGDVKSVRFIVYAFRNDTNARLKYFNQRNCQGLTCLHVAAQMNKYMIMDYLFVSGIDINIGDSKSGRTILHYAVESNDLKTVSYLLNCPNIDVECKTFKGETPLVMAYWRNYRDVMEMLKSSGAYFSYDIVDDSDEDYV